MRLLRYIIFILIIVYSGNSQGFDWQYSVRTPTKPHKLFLGAGIEYGFYSHIGDFSFIEKSTPCCTYENGKGSGYGFSLKSEYWQTGHLAYFAELSFSIAPGKFSATDIQPRRFKEPLETRYEFYSNYSYISGNFGAKYRLFDSHFHVGGLIQLAFMASSRSEYYEEIIGPEDEPPFSTNPPQYRREIVNGYIPDINNILITPTIQVGYDLNMGKGRYATPWFRLALPVMSISSEASWRRWGINAGVSFHTANLFNF